MPMIDNEEKKFTFVLSTLSGFALYIFLFICCYFYDFSTQEKITMGAAFTSTIDVTNTENVSELDEVTSTNGILPDYDGNQSDYLNIYRDLIVGRYLVFDKYVFDFTTDGSFSGFFDSNNPSVSGYLYEIIEIDDEPMLHIISNDKSSFIEYNIELRADKAVVLTYKNSNIEFALVRE